MSTDSRYEHSSAAHSKPSESYRTIPATDSRCDEDFYPVTDPQGFCLIINISQYEKGSRIAEDNEECCHGSQQDVKRVQKVFEKLRFIVKIEEDLNAEDMDNCLHSIKMSKELAKHGCFVCFLMARGSQGIIYTSDREPCKIDSIISKFKSSICRGLAEKPKIFFIQACRGFRGHGFDSDPREKFDVLPESNYMICYAELFSNSEHFKPCARKKDGYSFVQNACDYIEDYCDTEDLFFIIQQMDELMKKKSEFLFDTKMLSSLTHKVSLDPNRAGKTRSNMAAHIIATVSEIPLGFAVETSKNYDTVSASIWNREEKCQSFPVEATEPDETRPDRPDTPEMEMMGDIETETGSLSGVPFKEGTEENCQQGEMLRDVDNQTETGSFSGRTADSQPTAGTSVNPDPSQKQSIDELSKPKPKANPEFDRHVVLTGLRYSLCSIRNLPAGLASHESVRNIFARNLLPDTSPENSVHDLEGEEECKKMVLQTLIKNIKSYDSSKSNEPEFMECVEKLQCGDLTDEEVWNELMELADSIADHQWQLEETELTTLLRNSAKIIRCRLEALQQSDEARDHCPAAKAWFGFMMAAWSCLRTLVSESGDEAEKFKACMEPSGPVHHVEPSGPAHHVEPPELSKSNMAALGGAKVSQVTLHFAIKTSTNVDTVSVSTIWNLEEKCHNLEETIQSGSGGKFWYGVVNSQFDVNLGGVKVTDSGKLMNKGTGELFSCQLVTKKSDRPPEQPTSFADLDGFVPYFFTDQKAEFVICIDKSSDRISCCVTPVLPVTLRFLIHRDSSEVGEFHLEGNLCDGRETFAKSPGEEDTQVWSLTLEKVPMARYNDKLLLPNQQQPELRLIKNDNEVAQLQKIDLHVDQTLTYLIILDQQVQPSVFIVQHLELHICYKFALEKPGLQVKGNFRELETPASMEKTTIFCDEHDSATPGNTCKRCTTIWHKKVCVSAVVDVKDGTRSLKTENREDFQFVLKGNNTLTTNYVLPQFYVPTEPFAIFVVEIKKCKCKVTLTINPLLYELKKKLNPHLPSPAAKNIRDCLIPEMNPLGEMKPGCDPQETHDIWGDDLQGEAPGSDIPKAKSGLTYLKLRQTRHPADRQCGRRMILKRLSTKYHCWQDAALREFMTIFPVEQHDELMKINQNVDTNEYKEILQTVATSIRHRQCHVTSHLRLLRIAAAIVRGRTEALTLSPRCQAWEQENWERHLMAVEPWFQIVLALWETRPESLQNTSFLDAIKEKGNFTPYFYSWPDV